MMRDERLTDVGMNEVVLTSVSFSLLLPYPLFDPWLISSQLHLTPRDHTIMYAVVDCIPEHYRQNRLFALLPTWQQYYLF